MSLYPYLTDFTFLESFDNESMKERSLKVTLLTFKEKPIRTIEGKVISGSLNLDGSSSIRRSCTLTMIADKYKNDLSNIDNLFSINKKIKLEIGFKNTTSSYQNYDMIWFPLGVYVIINPSLAFSSSGVTISLQLKDKMALLNGECGGTLPAAVTFSEYDTTDENGNIVTLHPTLYQIIQEAVNHFGEEQLSKIIISDIDLQIKQVMRWTGNTPLYFVYSENDNDKTGHSLFATTDPESYHGTIMESYEYGDDIGYIYTDFVYANGDLVGEAGDSVCDVLDKIQNYLGNYEYFYDIEGNFVFQEIKNYLNTSQTTVELDKLQTSDYLLNMSKGKAVYVFDDSKIMTAYNNTPQYNNIKNDFIVWGKRENANGNEVALRYHLAIDQKPQLNNSYEVFFYTDPDDNLKKAKCPLKYPSRSQLPAVGVEGIFYMITNENIICKWDSKNKEYVDIDVNLVSITPTDWRTELYLQGAAAEPLGKDSNYYYTELANEWPKIYDVEGGTAKTLKDPNDGSTTIYYTPDFYDEAKYHPSDIDFFLDFIDTGAAISDLSIDNIGRRTYVVVDDDINCVFEPEIPDILFIENGQNNTSSLMDDCYYKSQEYVLVDSDIYSMLATGGTHNSAYNYVRELLYQYTSYNESITLTALPIYYLEPNVRITVRNNQAGIYGDYMINSISLPFDISGTMTISCTRALERI